MAFFVGLDSGGTKTECWLGDETRVLGRAVTGTAKLTRVGQDIATERMQSLLRDVSSRAGVDLREVTRTCVGVAGYSIKEVRELAALVVGQMVGGTVEVCGDDEIALDAAFHEGGGILVIGGTGAIVLGRCIDGTRYTAGGWGPMIGDEGSGFWIGREAVKRTFWAYDRGETTRLLEAIRQAWGVADLGGMVGFANARPGPDFAALAPVVAACAQAGDGLATRVLTAAGDELAAQVSVVWRKMLHHGEIKSQVAFTGSVVEKIARVRDRMREQIATGCEGLNVIEGAVNSMEGALWRARRGRSANL